MDVENNYCWKCGKKLFPDIIFCPYCGTRLDDKNEVSNELYRRKKFGITEIYNFFHTHKRIIMAFVCVSVLFNFFFMPWKREFTNQGKRNLYKNDQHGYGTFFYQPKLFCDGYSPQDYGLDKYYGTYVSYDYNKIIIHELGLLAIFVIGYKVYYLIKK